MLTLKSFSHHLANTGLQFFLKFYFSVAYRSFFPSFLPDQADLLLTACAVIFTAIRPGPVTAPMGE